jgi:hypothetical protein
MNPPARGLIPAALCAGLMLLPLSLAQAAQNEGEVEVSREGLLAIQLAQQYLATQQRSDGSFLGAMSDHTGIIASGVLAWMATGSLPGEGPYGRHVARGLEFLLSSQQPSGLLFRGENERHVMYEHGLATLCLAEAWGQTQDKRIAEKLKKAVELIVRCQNERGGWRYQPRVADDDLSVSVMQLIALRAAKDAGIAVPKETIDRALQYVENCRTRRHGEQDQVGFAYQPGQEKKWSTTAAGLMSLMLAGQYKVHKLKDGLEYLMREREGRRDTQWFVYGHYYAAQAMYQAGGQGEPYRKLWQRWYPDISKQLISRQIKTGYQRGRIEPEGRDSHYGVWSTSMSVLILAIPYRYLPIYQR